MDKNPAFSQAVIVPADVRTLVIGGQNGFDENGADVAAGFCPASALTPDRIIRVRNCRHRIE